MNYSDIRSTIKSGDLLAFSHEGWGSWHDFKVQMVRMFTRSEYSHVGIAWVVGDRVFCIEAVEPCARIYPLSKLGNFYWMPLKAPWKPSTEELALSYVGEEYKSLNAIKAFFKPLPKGDVSECAALAIQVAWADGIDLGNRATPDAVVEAAQAMGHPLYLVQNG